MSKPAKKSNQIIVVPDLPPSELVARFVHEFGKYGLPVSILREQYKIWDFTRYRTADGEPERCLDVRGQRYEVLTLRSRPHRTTSRIKKYFKRFAADGNTAALLTWCMETKPQGYFATIPDDEGLLWRDPASGVLSIPAFGYLPPTELYLVLYELGDEWYGPIQFVGFRELPS